MSTDFIVYTLGAGLLALIQAVLVLLPWTAVRAIGRVLGGIAFIVLGISFWTAVSGNAPPSCALIALCFGLSGLASVISGVLSFNGK